MRKENFLSRSHGTIHVSPKPCWAKKWSLRSLPLLWLQSKIRFQTQSVSKSNKLWKWFTLDATTLIFETRYKRYEISETSTTAKENLFGKYQKALIYTTLFENIISLRGTWDTKVNSDNTKKCLKICVLGSVLL